MRTASAKRRPVARVRIPVQLSEEDAAALDRYVDQHDFPTRNSAVRALIRRAARGEADRAAG